MVMQNRLAALYTETDEGEQLPFQLILLEGVTKRQIPMTHLFTSPKSMHQKTYEIEELVDLHIQMKTAVDCSVDISWGIVSDGRTDGDKYQFTLNQSENSQSIFVAKEKHPYPWRCGIYHFEVCFNEKTYYGRFEVKPKNINSEQWYKIHDLIQQHLEGLVTDYLHHKHTYSTLSSIENTGYWQFVKWYQKNEKNLHQAISLIENNSQSELTREYFIENEPKHLDHRSIRWQNTAKGQMFRGMKYMNRKMIVNFDSDANRYVKYRLLQILNKVDEVIDFLSGIYNHSREDYLQLKDDVATLEGRRRQLDVVSRITDRERQRVDHTLVTKKVEKQRIRNQVTRIEEQLNKCIESRTLLSNRIYSSLWANVDGKLPKRLVNGKHMGYQIFNQLWLFSKELPFNNRAEKMRLPVYKETYMLYEYYVYFGTIHLFNELGFSAVNDSVTEQLMTTFFDNGLKDGTTVTLQSGKGKVNLIFDEMIELNDDLALEKGIHFFSAGNHRKPDIRIDYYTLNNDSWQYVSSFIIEVKYRPFHNIYNHYGRTDTMEQMNDYWSIKYVYLINDEKKFEHNPIQNVVCVYPGDDRQPIVQGKSDGFFLQFYPNISTDDMYDISGKKELKGLLNDWLSKLHKS